MPSTKLAKALDLEDVKLLRYDYAQLWDCTTVIPLSCMQLDTNPREGALREGSRGGFRALIRADRRRRAGGGKGRVKGRLQGGGAREMGRTTRRAILILEAILLGGCLEG